MRPTRYYVATPNGMRVGPYFRRKAAERAAGGHGFWTGLDPALARGGRVVTRAEAKRRHSAVPEDPIAYAHAHVTSPGALALLAEAERGRARRGGNRDPA